MAEGEAIVIHESDQSGYPIGTRAEVVAKNLDPKTVPTCSQHVPGINAGCPYFDNRKRQCIFIATRNAEAGPEMAGWFKKLPNGAEQGFILPCYMFMEGEFDLWQQRHLTRVQYSRFYGVGEQVTFKVWKARHPTPDPNCHKCKKGDCNLMDQYKETRTVQPFPRPSESIQGDIFPRDEVLSTESSIALEHEASKRKEGTQVEKIMRERAEARRISERASGTP